MYSFAMMLWELATMQVPFAELPVMVVGLKASTTYCRAYEYTKCSA